MGNIFQVGYFFAFSLLLSNSNDENSYRMIKSTDFNFLAVLLTDPLLIYLCLLCKLLSPFENFRN